MASKALPTATDDSLLMRACAFLHRIGSLRRGESCDSQQSTAVAKGHKNRLAAEEASLLTFLKRMEGEPLLAFNLLTVLYMNILGRPMTRSQWILIGAVILG